MTAILHNHDLGLLGPTPIQPGRTGTIAGRIDWPRNLRLKKYMERRLHIEGLIAYRFACGEQAGHTIIREIEYTIEQWCRVISQGTSAAADTAVVESQAFLRNLSQVVKETPITGSTYVISH